VNAKLLLSVDVTHRGDRIDEVDGAPVSFLGEQQMGDEYKALLGDGDAKVSISVGAKVNGPQNTYSTVNVLATVTLRCGQDKSVVELATDLATTDAIRAVEDAMPLAKSMLIRVIEKGFG